MTQSIDIREVKVALQDRIVDLCAQLLPTGRREGSNWVSRNPVYSEGRKKTPALKVSLVDSAGISRGGWHDFRSGDKGDVLGLVAFLNGHDVSDMKFARAWAMDWLGLRSMSTDERRDLAKHALKRQQQQKKNEGRNRLRRLKAAERLFMMGAPWGEDTQAKRHALDYFRGRGLPIDDPPFNLDTATFRFSAATEYWRLAEWKTEETGRRVKVKPGPMFPAIHSAMRSPTGQLMACHVTFLDPMLPQKAPVAPPKLMFGEKKGAVIRVSHGRSNLPPEDDECPDILLAGEGIETTVKLALAMPDERAWASGDLGNFGNMPIDMACVGTVIIGRDNNYGNEQALKQFANAFEKLEAHGKPITTMNSPVGDDFADFQDE